MRDQLPPGSPPCTSDESWIDCLASTLPKLAEIQEPYLQTYQRQNPQVHHVYVNREEIPPLFPLDDLRILYANAYHSSTFGNAEYYAPLRDVLDPVRHIMRSHPTLEQVVSPIIGKDEFWMQILNSGLSTSPIDLIAGLMARAAELSGDGFRTAAEELNGLLRPVDEHNSAVVPGELDTGYDAVVYYGLTLREPIKIADGMVVLPSEETRRFVDEDWIDKNAPGGAAYHGWRSIGAVVRLFRWRPEYWQTGSIREPSISNPRSFLREASIFVDLLAVAHATPILPIAAMSNRIDRSAARLLGLEKHNGDSFPCRLMHSFDGFDLCPEPVSEAINQALKVFRNRKTNRFSSYELIVRRLSETLVGGVRFSNGNRLVNVTTELERMYTPPRWKISRKLQNRASTFLESSDARRQEIKEIIEKFYTMRSEMVHGHSVNMSPEEYHETFTNGFDIAQRTLFKLISEGPPENWGNLSTTNTKVVMALLVLKSALRDSMSNGGY